MFLILIQSFNKNICLLLKCKAKFLEILNGCLHKKLKRSSLTFLDKKKGFIKRELGPQGIEMLPSDQAWKMYKNHLLRAMKEEGQLFFSRNNLSKIFLPPPSDTMAIAQDMDAASIFNEHQNLLPSLNLIKKVSNWPRLNHMPGSQGVGKAKSCVIYHQQ